MRLFGSFVGAALVTGAGLAYYVYQRHGRTGESYLDVVKQLPGEVQRVSEEARRRAAEAVEKGMAAARRRNAELTRQLESAGSTPVTSPPPAPVPATAVTEPPAPAAEVTPPAAGPEPSAA